MDPLTPDRTTDREVHLNDDERSPEWSIGLACQGFQFERKAFGTAPSESGFVGVWIFLDVEKRHVTGSIVFPQQNGSVVVNGIGLSFTVFRPNAHHYVTLFGFTPKP